MQLNIKGYGLNINVSGTPYAIIFYQAVDYNGQPTTSPIGMIVGSPQDPSSTPYGTFPTIADAVNYYGVAQCGALISQINTAIGSTVYTSYDLELVDPPVAAALSSLSTVARTGQYNDLLSKPILSTVASTGSYTDLTGSPSFATVATTGVYNDLTGKPSLFNGDYNNLTNKPTIPDAEKCYENTTLRQPSFPIFKTGIVSSGVIVFHLTNDGLSSGTALFPNGIIESSINIFVSDAAASYQMSYALTNSNKTITITANKLGTANILTGILGQVQANGALVKLSIWGY